MKYIAQFERTEQVSEDSWRVRVKSAEISESTTIGEILNWYWKDNKIDDLREIMIRPVANLHHFKEKL